MTACTPASCWRGRQRQIFKPLSNEVADVEPEFQTALMRLIDLADNDGVTCAQRHLAIG